MGLFDDLLGGSKAQTPAPETATMPQGTTVTPQAIDDLLNMSAGNVTADMPSYTAQKAEGQAVTTDVPASLPASSPTQVPVTTAEAPASLIITDTAPETSAPAAVVTPEAVSAPVEAPVVSPVTTESSPMISVMSEEDTTPVVSFEESKTEPTVSFEAQKTEEVAPVVSLDAFGTQNETTTPNASAATTAESSSLFAFNETPKVEETLTVALEERKTEEVPVVSLFDEATHGTSPDNTTDFLVAGLKQLEAMEASLAERKQHFLEQAEAYRNRKEGFAQKEKQAREDAHSMDDEQKRIDSMKQYFRKQLDGPTINDSVGTAIAGIGVQNAVEKTIDSKKPSARRSARKTATAK